MSFARLKKYVTGNTTSLNDQLLTAEQQQQFAEVEKKFLEEQQQISAPTELTLPAVTYDHADALSLFQASDTQQLIEDQKNQHRILAQELAQNKIHFTQLREQFASSNYSALQSQAMQNIAQIETMLQQAENSLAQDQNSTAFIEDAFNKTLASHYTKYQQSLMISKNPLPLLKRALEIAVIEYLNTLLAKTGKTKKKLIDKFNQDLRGICAYHLTQGLEFHTIHDIHAEIKTHLEKVSSPLRTYLNKTLAANVTEMSHQENQRKQLLQAFGNTQNNLHEDLSLIYPNFAPVKELLTQIRDNMGQLEHLINTHTEKLGIESIRTQQQKVIVDAEKKLTEFKQESADLFAQLRQNKNNAQQYYNFIGQDLPPLFDSLIDKMEETIVNQLRQSIDELANAQQDMSSENINILRASFKTSVTHALNASKILEKNQTTYQAMIVATEAECQKIRGEVKLASRLQQTRAQQAFSVALQIAGDLKNKLEEQHANYCGLINHRNEQIKALYQQIGKPYEQEHKRIESSKDTIRAIIDAGIQAVQHLEKNIHDQISIIEKDLKSSISLQAATANANKAIALLEKTASTIDNMAYQTNANCVTAIESVDEAVQTVTAEVNAILNQRHYADELNATFDSARQHLIKATQQLNVVSAALNEAKTLQNSLQSNAVMATILAESISDLDSMHQRLLAYVTQIPSAISEAEQSIHALRSATQIISTVDALTSANYVKTRHDILSATSNDHADNLAWEAKTKCQHIKIYNTLKKIFCNHDAIQWWSTQVGKPGFGGGQAISYVHDGQKRTAIMPSGVAFIYQSMKAWETNSSSNTPSFFAQHQAKNLTGVLYQLASIAQRKMQETNSSREKSTAQVYAIISQLCSTQEVVREGRTYRQVAVNDIRHELVKFRKEVMLKLPQESTMAQARAMVKGGI